MTGFFSHDDEIHCIARGMVDTTLPDAEWTHAAHFAAAFWLLRYEGGEPLEKVMPRLIRRYNLACGRRNTDTSGYHATITLASIWAARHAVSLQPSGTPLHQAVNQLLASELGDRDWLLSYWSKSRLFSVEARRTWVEPDLEAFPY